jgi:hypothetical protein
VTVNDATVLVAKSEKDKSKVKPKKDQAPKRENAETSKSSEGGAKGGGAKGGGSSKPKSDSISQSSSDKKPPKKSGPRCVICSDFKDVEEEDKKHWAQNCPFLDSCRKVIKEGQVATYSHANCEVNLDSVILTMQSEPRTEVIAAASREGLQWYEVLLDNQASISCFRSPQLCSNTKEADTKIRITGVGGAIISSQVTSVKHFENVETYFCDSMLANVLCYAHVADRYSIKWNQKHMCFNVHVGGSVIRFKRKNDIFVADFRPFVSKQVLASLAKKKQPQPANDSLSSTESIAVTPAVVLTVKEETLNDIPQLMTYYDSYDDVQVNGSVTDHGC